MRSRWAPLLLLLVVSGALSCVSGDETVTSGRAPAEPPPENVPKLKKHQFYVDNPTEIVGDEVTAILPDFYADELELEGLGTGWTTQGEKRTWEGSGDCLLALRSLRIHCRMLTVTLAPAGDEPEVLIQASGRVSLAQQVKGVGSWFENLQVLWIRNERMRMVEN